MKSEEIRKKFLEFFEARGHKIVPSSSLIPGDPSVLLTTAGMQQFKPYFTGKADPMKDFGSKNTASVQKSFRTSDIDEVGDESHLTFFEMLGNFSFGGYFKEDAIKYAHEFITSPEWMNLNIDYVTVFGGDDEVPRDDDSRLIWEKLGIRDIRDASRADNFWGPTGSEGPCGPTTEIYVKNSQGKPIEIWNIVFNEYYCHSDKRLEKLKTPGVDTGMGLERLAMVVQNKNNIFETDLFSGLMSLVPNEDIRVQRVISDHVRGAVHLIADGLEPSNKDRGYILRRLLRRAAFHMIDVADEQTAIPLNSRSSDESWNERSSIKEIAANAIRLSYFEIKEKADYILQVIDKEIGDFLALLKSRKELGDLIRSYSSMGREVIAGEDAFKLFSTFGIPIDYIKDRARRADLGVDVEGFDAAFKKHQGISRAGQEKKFGGHGLIFLDTGELKAKDEAELKKVTRLHTATHMLQQALREVLGPEVKQMGSDITVERTRFDFAFSRKLTPDEIKAVEEKVNEKIHEDLPMQKTVLPKAEAEKTGALYFFREKYPDPVNVYFIGKDLESAWSKEFCGGPHVTHTGEIGEFKIAKEEAVGAGMRRIRGIVIP